VSFYFADKASPEIGEAVRAGATVIVPVGTVEEHGPHLPVSADTTIAEQVAAGAAEILVREAGLDVLVTPAIWSGYSGAVMSRWPGTIRVRTRVVMDLVRDVVGSIIEMGFRRICIFNTHGHHAGLLRTVTRELADDYGVYVSLVHAWSLAKPEFAELRQSEPGGAIHAGEVETSLMLHYGRPVDMSKATSEDLFRYKSQFISGDGYPGGAGVRKVFYSTWGLQPSKTGAYGDPTVASAATGAKLHEMMTRNLASWIVEFHDVTARGEADKEP
jgi:creatinine amidohydrolase